MNQTTGKPTVTRNASGVDEVYVKMWAGNVRKDGRTWIASPSDMDYPSQDFDTRADAVAYLLATVDGSAAHKWG